MFEDVPLRVIPAIEPPIPSGPIQFMDSETPGVYIQGADALRFAAIVARFIRNPCQLSRDAEFIVKLADLVDLLITCAVEGTAGEELRRLVQSRVVR